MFDISAVKEKYTDHQSMVLLEEQDPNVYACVPLTHGPRRYLEVYITHKKDCDDIVNNGLVFPGAKLKVFPCSSLDDSAKTVNLELSNLPLLPKKDVLSGLQRSLAVFGTIMGLDIFRDSATGFFMVPAMLP